MASAPEKKERIEKSSVRVSFCSGGAKSNPGFTFMQSASMERRRGSGGGGTAYRMGAFGTPERRTTKGRARRSDEGGFCASSWSRYAP